MKTVPTAQDKRVPVPRLALSVSEAAESLGLSWGAFNRYVAGELRWIRRGRRKLVAVRELERWLDAHAEFVLGEEDE